MTEEMNMTAEEIVEDGFDSFCRLASGAIKNVQRLKAARMMPYGLTGAHTVCLRRLYRSHEGLTRTKLCELCDVDKAQISRILGDLCAKGYAVESESEVMNYRKCVRLTAMGMEIAAAIDRSICQVTKEVSGDIPREELDSFYKTLRHICERLAHAEISPEDVGSAEEKVEKTEIKKVNEK